MKNTIMVNGRRMVCRIFDIGDAPDAPMDRYTIAFKGYRVEGYGMVYPYLACNEAPFHPQGFGLYEESKHFLTGKSLGKRVEFGSLPEQVQKFILQSI